MIKSTTIRIKDKDYLIKKNFASLMEFENIFDKNVFRSTTNLTDAIQMEYCILKTNNTIDFTFNEFVTYLDEDESILTKYYEYLSSLIKEETEDTKDKKKETKKK